LFDKKKSALIILPLFYPTPFGSLFPEVKQTHVFTCKDIVGKLKKMIDVNNTNILFTIKEPIPPNIAL